MSAVRVAAFVRTSPAFRNGAGLRMMSVAAPAVKVSQDLFDVGGIVSQGTLRGNANRSHIFAFSVIAGKSRVFFGSLQEASWLQLDAA